MTSEQQQQQSRTKNRGIARLLKAVRYSLQGLASAWKSEAAFRQESVLAVFLVPLAVWLGDTPVETALLLFSILLVMVVELLNSAIEAIVDRIGPEHHPLSGKAKDLGSAAVFLSLGIVLVVWGFIIGSKVDWAFVQASFKLL